ncbi:intradiol ring-cleavage dioxygenase [Phyllobacterium zundukense]|uniref:Intradiol ring-cleavage dioxygenase n=1 Tax=Phyllobacterium zundukense TaxID=1867719 RepID=A0A2N9VQL0_9HYPH|nr:intradiol ring-cleavage dioxygenase [Phyllobacterium zundukense]ATU94254.1 intradiol ring-cleavage dioxygenase [Phyllobacterium zundukense]PIO41778.1 intradiol ring-cleavage dioxygenase [Phyllobacterium zundukense]
MKSTRRSVLAAFLAVPSIKAAGIFEANAAQSALELTPACKDADELTITQTEGPYYKPSSPLKQDFAADAPDGMRITLGGFVLETDCKPVDRALVELWHADEHGSYDRVGYRLRGHQFTDQRGRWWFSTIIPSLYPGRTRHYHVKVQKPGGNVLTTQLYFPGEPLNARDRIFDERLLLRMRDTADGKFGRFDFIV